MEPAWIAVLTISLGLALVNSIFFIVGSAMTPHGTVFLGTIHYWEDYFFYLNHFFQGAHGQWLTINRFTSEKTTPSIVYWINILFGKLGGILGITPINTYNAMIIVLSFIALVLSFIVVRKLFFPTSPMSALLGFVFANLSAPFIDRITTQDGTFVFWPIQIWRTPHLIFNRLGGVPLHIVQTIFFYILLLFFFNKNTHTGKLRSAITLLALCMVAIALTSINPIEGIFWGVIVITSIVIYSVRYHVAIFHHFDIKRIFIILVCIAISFIYMSSIFNTEPHIQSKLWEAQQQVTTTWSVLFLSIGPVLVLLACIGIASRIKQLHITEWFGILCIGLGNTLFMSPLPKIMGFSNVRILFPAANIFWGVFAVYGANWLAVSISKRVRVKQQLIMSLLVMVFLLSIIPTLLWEISIKIPNPSMISDPLIYLPKNIYNGFSYLATITPYDDIVIANPAHHLDTLIPALSGHTTYSGHLLQTMHNDLRQQDVSKLFTHALSAESAYTWLIQNKIRYVVFVQTLDGDNRMFEEKYSFLKRTFSHTGVYIYSID